MGGQIAPRTSAYNLLGATFILAEFIIKVAPVNVKKNWTLNADMT